MTHDNIKKLISHTIRKILFIWILLFTLIFGTFIVYGIHHKTVQFINDQILAISEINTEITSVLYYNSQKSIADEIDFSKTLISQWVTLQEQKFTQIIPNSIPEIKHLKELGEKFYSSETLKSQKDSISTYQDLNNQLDLLKRLAFNHLHKSFLNLITPLLPLILLGLLLINIVMTFLFANNLQRKILIKNEFILEDIWNEIQGFRLMENDEEEDSKFEPYKEESIETIYYPGTQHINTLIESSKELTDSILITKEYILSQQKHSGIVTVPNQNMTNEYPNISEKIVFIQKLLSRLFTRAERSATLAKSTADNGFQAGILALNISIEAARTGESGRNFIPFADRVKDFAEKSNQLGKAILEELKDIDLSIRKAYAMSKNIIEELNQFNIFSSTEEMMTTPKNLTAEEQMYFQDIVDNFDKMFEISRYIQTISTNLETTIEIPKTTTIAPTVNPYSKKFRFLKELLIRSFERLYRFNYGIDPPKNPFSQDQ